MLRDRSTFQTGENEKKGEEGGEGDKAEEGRKYFFIIFLVGSSHARWGPNLSRRALAPRATSRSPICCSVNFP